MARKREDSFKIALEALRGELRRGVHPAGARLTANEIAERLRLSQTPVREALSRLAGEGLLQDRRGQGFFVPTLSERDIVVLFQLQRELLRIACGGERSRISADDIERISLAARGDGPRDLSLESERLLRLFVGGSSAALARHLGRLHDQLAAVRGAENRLLDGLEDELVRLGAAVIEDDAPTLMAVLGSFIDRRIQAAPALARHQGAGPNIESI